MTESLHAPAWLADREAFLDRIIARLGRSRCDFQTTFRRLAISERTGQPNSAAGVLVPLLFQEAAPGGNKQFMFQLIKRSSLVPQAGDLSFPGGMLHPILDRLLRPLLSHGPFPVMGGEARMQARQKNPDSFKLITLFLANALRESWEEIGLIPTRVRFLGPLPPYSLTLFRRTIFPLVGFVDRPGTLRPNREVEKIVRLPVSAFYNKEAFGRFQLGASAHAGRGLIQYPCLIHRDSDGMDEMLWGATFHIIVGFLGIVLNYNLPDWKKGPVIFREMHVDYLTGRPASR